MAKDDFTARYLERKRAAPRPLPLPTAARTALREGTGLGAMLPRGMEYAGAPMQGGGGLRALPTPTGRDERESTRRESLQARQISQGGVNRYLQQETVRDNRQALHDVLAGEQAALEAQKAAEAAYTRLRQQETRRQRSRERAAPELVGQLKTAAQAAEERRRGVQGIHYVKDHLGKTYEDNFGGQFGASMEMGRLNQDAALAWSRYLSQPTEENRAYAEAVGALMSNTALRNKETLDEDATLPWLSQSLAGYLPQFVDQTAAGVKGALSGAALGTMAAGPAGAATGAKAGYVAGRTGYGFETMQGAAFKSLLDAGVPEEIARKAAKDEAFVNSLIEAADAGVDLVTLGGGKLLSLLGKGGAKAAATAAGESALKQAGRILAGYGLNILGEGAQEYVQEGVSIANQRRALEGQTGQLDLAGRALGVVGDAVTGRDGVSAAQMNRAGAEGMKIAAMAGGASLAGNTVMGHALTRPQSPDKMIDSAYGAMLENGMFSPEAREAAARADAQLGIETGPRPLLTFQQAEEAQAQQKTAPMVEAGAYRANVPENVELPTVPIINLSMDDVAALNRGVLPDSGGYLRKTATERARVRLGLDQNSAAYIPASNVLRNGEEYILKITKASLDKMFSPSDGSIVSPETVAVVENLERIANNGVYFQSEGDRKGRDQMLGVDHLMTTVYIDNVPYVVDMRVRVLQEGEGGNKQNVLYYLTPEAITTIKKADGGTSAAGRPASDGEAPPSSNTRIAPGDSGVKGQFTREAITVVKKDGDGLPLGTLQERTILRAGKPSPSTPSIAQGLPGGNSQFTRETGPRFLQGSESTPEHIKTGVTDQGGVTGGPEVLSEESVPHGILGGNSQFAREEGGKPLHGGGRTDGAEAQVHIDDRTWADAGNRKVKAFQYDNPELHEYFADAARQLMADLKGSVKGERTAMVDRDGYITGYTGTSRMTSEPMEMALDNAKLSYDQIEKALNHIIGDHGQENYAAAKKVELVLDTMLSEGFTDIEGSFHAPDGNYAAIKARIKGALGTGSNDYRMSEEEWTAQAGGGQSLDADLESLYRSAPPETAQDDGDYYESLFQEEPPLREGDTPEYLDALTDWVNGTTDGFLGDTAMEGALGGVAAVRTDRIVQDKTAGEKAGEAWSFFKRKMVDAGDSVTQVGKATGDKYLYPFYNFARASANAAESMIRPKGAQTDVSGKPMGPSVADLWEPVRAKGKEYYHAFEHYLFSRHNVDRMSRADRGAVASARNALEAFDERFPEIARMPEEDLKSEAINGWSRLEAGERLKLLEEKRKAEAVQNKPVFAWEVDADTSRADVARYEREHPEFAALAEKVYQFNRNLMQYRVDSGLLTREQADHIEAICPNYVPTFREGYQPDGARGGKGLQVGKTVGRAQGGTSDLMPLHVAMARQTMKVVREGAKNRFGARLLDHALDNKGSVEPYVKTAEEYAHTVNQDTFDALEDNTPQMDNTFTVYRDGKAWVMTLDPGLFEGVQALSPKKGESNVLTKTVKGANDLFKALVTGYNPMFMARNFARDLQDAGLYSRDLKAWAASYPKAVKEIAKDGAMWRQYKALGGVYSSVFDYDHGYNIEKERSALQRQTVDRVEALNMAIEQAPRLAEFMAIAGKGDGSMESLMDAMLGAADVTVNFGRGGTWGKQLNQNFVPFLNPGIQGFDKMVRRFFGKKSAGEWQKLLVRASALAIAPALINGLLYRDDPEWEDLRESDKDTNYLVKLGDGQWLKIPKGRDASVIGILSTRGGQLLRGDQVDWGAALKTAANQIAPANPLENNIMAAWVDADLMNRESPGRTWYGGDIESQRLQGYLPGQRYDEGTDVFSKWLGGALNLSPKKINYLLDQYSGVVGDFVLPLLSPKGNKNPLAPVKTAFVLDSVNSNKLNGEFYDTADQITYAKNGGDPAMGVVGRFWNKQAGAVSDIYAQMREIENDTTLPNREKQEQIRAAKAIINGIEKNALGVLSEYEEAVRRHYTDDSDTAMDETYREANREVFGAEYALEVYNKGVYAKATESHAGGLSFDDFYDAYFTMQEAGGEGKGKTDRQRAALLEIDGLTPEEKAQLGTVILGDKRALDYSDPDALAVSLLPESTRGKAEEAQEAGISYGVFLEAYRAQLGVEGEKNRAGETIRLSEARNRKAAVDAATPGLSAQERRILYRILGISQSVWGYLPK